MILGLLGSRVSTYTIPGVVRFGKVKNVQALSSLSLALDITNSLEKFDFAYSHIRTFLKW